VPYLKGYARIETFVEKILHALTGKESQYGEK
jgi:hypothetical protein